MMEKEGLIGLQIAQGFVWYKSVVKAHMSTVEVFWLIR